MPSCDRERDDDVDGHSGSIANAKKPRGQVNWLL